MPTLRRILQKVIMMGKSTVVAVVLIPPMLFGNATKTDWEDWNRHGFNHPYHENNIIVRLEAGETINDICDCGFFSVNTRQWMLDRQLISEEHASRFCPGLSEFDNDVQASL